MAEVDAAQLTERALDLFEHDNIPEAIDEISKAIELEPWNGETWRLRAAMRLSSGDVSGAEQDSSHAIGRGSDMLSSLRIRAAARYAQEKWEAAIEDCNVVIQMDPSIAFVWSTRGRAKGALEDAEGAFQDCDHAIRLDSSDAGAWRVRGAAKLEFDDADGAVSDLSRAISLNPKDRRSYLIRSAAFSKLGRHGEAQHDRNIAAGLADDTFQLPETSDNHNPEDLSLVDTEEEDEATDIKSRL